MVPKLLARLRSRTAIAPRVLKVELDLIEPRPLLFRAGQFVTLTALTNNKTKAVRRSYSIASGSDRGEVLDLLVRVADGDAAAEYFTDLPLGTHVNLTGPEGSFVLDARHPGDIVFAATGTGLAPVMSMLSDLRASTERRRRWVFWGMRSESDLFVLREIEALCASAQATLFVHLTRPSTHWNGARGRIIPAILAQLPILHEPTFYLVGNNDMIRELRGALVAAGIDRQRQIRTEAHTSDY